MSLPSRFISLIKASTHLSFKEKAVPECIDKLSEKHKIEDMNRLNRYVIMNMSFNT